jgi:hypothetical protein
MVVIHRVALCLIIFGAVAQLIAATISSTNPASNEKAAARPTNVEATADVTINNATVTQSTYRVQGEWSGRINGSYGAIGSTIQLDPASDLKSGERVRVTATTGIESLSASPLSKRVWQFTAASAEATAVLAPHPTTPSFDFGTYEDVALGDLDGDGDIDSIFAHAAEVPIKVNDGAGNFTAHPTKPQISLEAATAVAMGDLDGDGDLDLIIGRYDSASDANKVMLNPGTGHFTLHSAFGPAFVLDLELGDVDGDGDLDLIAVDAGVGAARWLNDGTGLFSSPLLIADSSGLGSVTDAALGDIDNDGDLDGVFATTGAELVMKNDGNGVFSPAGSFGAHNSYDTQLGDLDGDGDLDALVTNYSQPETVWLNDGSGTFTAHATASFGASSQGSSGSALGDLDGDGDLDAIVANFQTASTLWLNDGSGAFAAHPMPSTLPVLSMKTAIADLDGDGDLDALFTRQASFAQGGAVNVFVNRNFAAIPPVDAPSSFAATATSDSRVALSWQPVFDSTAYEVYRAPNLISSFTLLTTIAGTSHPDLSVGPDTTYLYKVRAINSSGAGPFSAVNIATTVIFSNASLTGVAIKALHLIELRTAIGAMRAAADLSAAPYTDPSVTSGATKIRRVHLDEMRAALDAARAPLGLSQLAYTDPLIVSGSTVIKAIHLAELRAGTQ